VVEHGLGGGEGGESFGVGLGVGAERVRWLVMDGDQGVGKGIMFLVYAVQGDSFHGILM